MATLQAAANYINNPPGPSLDEIRIQEFKAHYKLDPDVEHLEFGRSVWDQEHITSTQIIFIAEKYSKLKFLSISNLKTRLWLIDGIFDNIPIAFPNLTFLHVSNCPNMDGPFSLRVPLLKRLEVYDNPALKEIKVRAPFSAQIVVRSPLSKVKVERLSLEDSDLELIKDAQPESVEFLDLSYCDKITDTGLKCLFNLRPKKLSLRGCKRLTTAGIVSLIDNLGLKLRNVDLGEMPQLRFVARFIASSLFHESWFYLESVDLTDNPELSDRDFIASSGEMGVKHVRWSSLSISNCCKLTDRFFYCQSTTLKELRADHLPLLTDQALEGLKQNPLVKLSIAKCKQIADAGLKALEKCKTLRMLNVKGCPFVTWRGVHSLSKAISGIQILHDLDSTTQSKVLE